ASEDLKWMKAVQMRRIYHSCVHRVNLSQPDSMSVQRGQSLTSTCQVSGYSLTDNSDATGWIRQLLHDGRRQRTAAVHALLGR
uniref:Ig-like domain-containing protein n=1 Tax=Salarias fasciatus TaxID=181472 RepID=A0A672HUS0_SALFA